MEKIVDTPVKIDLHIHSNYSLAKDKDKVKDNTLNNLPILVSKLNENNVNICAITDHDKFSYELYNTLKKEENVGSIKKVLPGVEFTVIFNKVKSNQVDISKPVHVITIFNDNDDDKLRILENLLGTDITQLQYSSGKAFTEEEYLEILKKVNLDTVMIAHQKNRLDSKTKSNDANNSGSEFFDYFLMTNYFEAFEFRNKKNEVFMNGYVIDKNYQEVFRTITASDCHSWKVYPNIDDQTINDSFSYTFLKCLPNFRGVVMAITDYRRIKKVDSFFSASDKYCKELSLENNGKLERIPLSRGLNVIIGGNSIGKSLLLHKITKYEKKGKSITQKLKDSYDSYLESKNCKVLTNIEENNIYIFDMQGEVREKFENKGLKSNEFLKKYFPSDLETTNYKKTLDNEIDNYCNSLKNRKNYNNLLDNLSTFEIKDINYFSKNIVFVNFVEVSQVKFTGLNSIVSDLVNIDTNLLQLNKNEYLLKEDIEEFISISKKIKDIKIKYDNLVEYEKYNIACKSCITTVITDKTTQIASKSSGIQKKYENYIRKKDLVSSKIVDLVKAEKLLFNYNPNIIKEVIKPYSIKVYNYNFISKLEGVKEISNDYIFRLIKSIYRINTKLNVINPEKIDETLKSKIKGGSDDVDIIESIRNKIKKQIINDLKNTNAITKDDEKNLYRELSSGFNSRTYFDLIAYDEMNEGIYIIDQPEDNVSQNAIKNYVLDRFKTMSYNRQIILVTHNPQFIINLDVDNVIFLGVKDDKLIVQSGALEYSDEDYNILHIVAENIDGGIDTINKRWKRYEKNINF